MEWYIAVIMTLSASSVGSLIFIVNLVSMIDKLRIDNTKLRIDILHK